MTPTLIKNLIAMREALDDARFYCPEEIEKYCDEAIDLFPDTLRMLEEKDAALLLAARWFKLNLKSGDFTILPSDCRTMFDAMQAARLQPPQALTTEPKGEK